MRLTLAKFNLKKLLFFHEGAKWPKELLVKVTADAIVKPDFITEPEEATLMKEVEPHMKRLKYEKEHWDDVSELMFFITLSGNLLVPRKRTQSMESGEQKDHRPNPRSLFPRGYPSLISHSHPRSRRRWKHSTSH